MQPAGQARRATIGYLVYNKSCKIKTKKAMFLDYTIESKGLMIITLKHVTKHHVLLWLNSCMISGI